MPASWGIIPILPENGGPLTDGEEKMTKMPMELLFGDRQQPFVSGACEGEAPRLAHQPWTTQEMRLT